MTIEKEDMTISLVDSLPMPDSVGIKGDSKYTFTLSNKGTANLSYNIKLIDDLGSQSTCQANNNNKPCNYIPSEFIHYQITKEKGTPVVGGLRGNNSVTTGVIN
ncbi:MAG: hypothetical protein RSE91_04965, partial [Bacilli bacterium]